MYKLRKLSFSILTGLIGFSSLVSGQVSFSLGSLHCGARSEKEKPLFEAVSNNNSRLAGQLLQKGADPNLKDDCGYPLISYAAHRVQPELLKILIKSGAEVNVIDPINKNTLLLRVIAHDYVDYHRVIDVDDENRDAEKILEAVKALVDAGADVNGRDENETSPLIAAASVGDEKLVDLLLAAGADVNAADNGDRTAYSYAAGLGNKEIKKKLIESGVDTTIGVAGYQKKYGARAFYTAAGDGRTDIVEALIAGGTDVNSTIGAKMTALMVVSKDSTIDALIAAGADVNLKDEGGYTALIWASAFGKLNLVEKLIAAGADINVRNNDGKSALDFANFPGIGATLIENGALRK